MTEIRWVKLELDLRDFNPGPFLAPVPAGVRVMTLPELGDGQRRRRQIYELNRDCAADIPERGDFFSWAEYQRARFDVPQFRPEGQLLAVTGDELVGLCQVSRRPEAAWAFVEMTGVRRDWRTRGVATALKLEAIEAARAWGATHLRTVHHPNNDAIIAANRKLGFHDADFTLRSE